MTTTNKPAGTTLISAKGSIKFASLARSILNKHSGKSEYLIRLQFDGTSPEGMTFKKAIMGINSKKIVTSRLDAEGNETVPRGHFLVAFPSAHQPTVIAEDGTVLDPKEIPFFYSATDSGEAIVECAVGKVVPGATNPPYIRLAKVQLSNMNIAPREGSVSSIDDIRAKLAASA